MPYFDIYKNMIKIKDLPELFFGDITNLSQNFLVLKIPYSNEIKKISLAELKIILDGQE